MLSRNDLHVAREVISFAGERIGDDAAVAPVGQVLIQTLRRVDVRLGVVDVFADEPNRAVCQTELSAAFVVAAAGASLAASYASTTLVGIRPRSDSS